VCDTNGNSIRVWPTYTHDSLFQSIYSPFTADVFRSTAIEISLFGIQTAPKRRRPISISHVFWFFSFCLFPAKADRSSGRYLWLCLYLSTWLLFLCYIYDTDVMGIFVVDTTIDLLPALRWSRTNNNRCTGAAQKRNNISPFIYFFPFSFKVF